MQSQENGCGKSVQFNVLETNLASSTDSTVKCECGAEIILVSDQKVMSKVIATHVDKHRKMIKDCSKTDAENQGEAELEAERIENYLITQVFKKVWKQKS